MYRNITAVDRKSSIWHTDSLSLSTHDQHLFIVYIQLQPTHHYTQDTQSSLFQFTHYVYNTRSRDSRRGGIYDSPEVIIHMEDRQAKGILRKLAVDKKEALAAQCCKLQAKDGRENVDEERIYKRQLAGKISPRPFNLEKRSRGDRISEIFSQKQKKNRSLPDRVYSIGCPCLLD